MTRDRRRTLILVLAALAGAGCCAGAAALTWWSAEFTDSLVGAVTTTATGSQVLPELVPVALFALAGLGAAFATRGWPRRVVGRARGGRRCPGDGSFGGRDVRRTRPAAHRTDPPGDAGGGSAAASARADPGRGRRRIDRGGRVPDHRRGGPRAGDGRAVRRPIATGCQGPWRRRRPRRPLAGAGRRRRSHGDRSGATGGIPANRAPRPRGRSMTPIPGGYHEPAGAPKTSESFQRTPRRACRRRRSGECAGGDPRRRPRGSRGARGRGAARRDQVAGAARV